MRIWSELRAQRLREMAADLATLVWILLWVNLGIRLYGGLAELSSVGTSIGDAGSGIQDAGSSIGDALSNIPLIGEGAGNVVDDALNTAGSPLVDAGASLEQLLLTIAALLGLLLVAVALVPWLNRYVPWRIARWQRLRAGARAIHRGATAPAVADADFQRLLASRAIHRLEYADLLDYTPDPYGDFMAGRHDRLAEAEMASVGLGT